MVLGLFVIIQFVPYGRDHSNPPVVAEPAWDSPTTRELSVRSCFDCHSNETKWAWYSNIAPLSWLIQNHVEEGREELNFSEWHLDHEGEEAAETVRDGSMPTRGYLLMHSEARLSDVELSALVSGLATTLGDEGNGENDEGQSERDDADEHDDDAHEGDD